MQSKMLLGVLSALFTISVLFVLAVPRPRPGTQGPRETSPQAPAPYGKPGSDGPQPLAVESDPVAELVEGIWCPAGYGICLPAPEGWVASRRRSRAYLHRDPARPLAGNFSLITLPNLYGKTLEGLLEDNRAELEANPQFELHAIAIQESAGSRRIRVDYSGTPSGGSAVRFIGLIWLEGAQQLVLTFTADATLWSELEPLAERSLAELSRGPRPSGAEDPATGPRPDPSTSAPTRKAGESSQSEAVSTESENAHG